MAELSPEVELQLAKLSEGEWAALTAKVRAPDVAEQYREIAKAVVPEHVLDHVMGFANVAAFVDDAGQLDEDRVRQTLAAMFPSLSNGSGGRAVAAARQGKNSRPADRVAANGPGVNGRAEAQRRSAKMEAKK
jgi:hypothetical protein